MKRVLIVSYGFELDKVLSLINHEKTLIKKIVTLPTTDLNDILNKWNVDRNIVHMYPEMPDVIAKEYFDYIITSDEMKNAGTKNRIVEDVEYCGFPGERIINMSHFSTIPFFSIYNVLKNFSAPKDVSELNNCTFFVTGVSHAYAGTDISEFSQPGMKLALTSQDLFYDYELAKIAIRTKKKLKYAVIGVAPFSLYSDLSKSVNVDRTFTYYPVTKKLHNCPVAAGVLAEIFNDAYNKAYELMNPKLVFNSSMVCNSLNKDFGLNDLMEVREKMGLSDKKEYPDTVAENTKILRSYIQDCLKANIVPNLVIYPLSEFYNQYFSRRKFEQLRETLTDFSNEFKIPFLDFANDKNFTISDFFDVEHLNVRGSKKFSRILDDVLFHKN